MLQIDDMLGPTPEARQLQFEQHRASDAMYAAYDAARQRLGQVDHSVLWADAAVQAAQRHYDSTVAALEVLLGVDAHCNYLDSDLFSAYSDAYKDQSGHRPRHHVTRAQAKAFFEPAVLAA